MFGSRYVRVFLRVFDRVIDGFSQTSLDKTGSDAMNAAGDYSSAYCILSTDSEFTGHGMVCYIFLLSIPRIGRLVLLQ